MTDYVSETSIRHTRTVQLTDDAPQVSNAEGGITVQPQRLDYTWVDDGVPVAVEVGGPRVLRDGSRGAWRTIVLVLALAPSGYYATAPQWIRDLVTTDPR